MAAIWALADEGADFDETLDALISDGLRSLTGFVLVSTRRRRRRRPHAGRGARRGHRDRRRRRRERRARRRERHHLGRAHPRRRRRAWSSTSPRCAEGAATHTIELGLVRVSRLTRGTPPAAADPVAHRARRRRHAHPGAALALAPELRSIPTPRRAGRRRHPRRTSRSPHRQTPAPVVDDALEDDLAAEPAPAPEPEVVSTAPTRTRASPPPPCRSPTATSTTSSTPSPRRPTPATRSACRTTPTAACGRPRRWSPPTPTPSPPRRRRPAPFIDPLADPLGDPLAGPADDDQPTETFAATPGRTTSPDADDERTTRRLRPRPRRRHRLSPFDDEEYRSSARPGSRASRRRRPSPPRPVARLLIADRRDRRRRPRGAAAVARRSRARSAGTEDPLLVTRASPHQEISSTHVEVAARLGRRPRHRGGHRPRLHQRHRSLVQPGLDARGAAARRLGAAVPGAIIDLGDGVTIQVTRP